MTIEESIARAARAVDARDARALAAANDIGKMPFHPSDLIDEIGLAYFQTVEPRRRQSVRRFAPFSEE